MGSGTTRNAGGRPVRNEAERAAYWKSVVVPYGKAELTPGEQRMVAKHVAGILRALRFGTGEAHGRAMMMEFNYLLENKALAQGADGLYTIDYAGIAGLCEALLTFEAHGDRAGVEAWFTKYDVMPASLTKALEATKGIPVDVTPEFELSQGMRP